MSRIGRWLPAVGLGVLAAAALSGCTGAPPTFAVNTFVDGVDANPGDGICEVTAGARNCSLRAAIQEANASAAGSLVINVASGTYTLTITGGAPEDANLSGDLDLDSSAGTVSIRGLGAGARIDAQGADHAIEIHRGADVDLDRIAFTGATDAGVLAGAPAVVDLTRAAAFSNPGAGIAVEPGATLRARNTTTSTNGSGGIRNDGSASITFVTVTANTGGGLIGSSPVTASASVVAGQVGGATLNCPTAPVSAGDNALGHASCAPSAGETAANVALTALSSGADVVPHHAPTRTSVAVNRIAGTRAVCSTLTPADTDGRVGARRVGVGCDPGAVEADYTLDLVVNDTSDRHDTSVGDGICRASGDVCTLRAAVDEANATAATETHRIRFAVDPVLTLTGGDNTNAGGDIDVLAPVAIDGDGHQVTGGAVDRPFHHLSNHQMVIEDLRIVGSTPISALGGGMWNEVGALTLRRVQITGNNAGFSGTGGGLEVSSGTISIEESAITGNTARDGAGVNVTGGSVSIRNSTISGNTATGSGSAFRQTSGTMSLVLTTVHGSGATVIVRSAGAFTVAGSVLAADQATLCQGPTLVSTGFNVVGDSSCGPGTGTDAIAVNPLLGPAEVGPAGTVRVPRANSPVVGRIPTGTATLCDGSIAIDQRGTARPAGGSCDSGAVEGASVVTAPSRTFVVDRAADAVDASIGDGACAVAGGGCSLRAAVQEAGAGEGDTTIDLATGIDPILSLAGTGEDLGATGDLDVVGFVRVQGHGQTVNAALLDAGFHHRGGVLVIDDLTIRRAVGGGAVVNVAGDVLVVGSRIYGGSSSDLAMAGVTTTAGSTVVRDTRLDGAGLGRGGGVVHSGTGSTLIDGVLLTGNVAPASQRTSAAIRQSAGTLNVARSTISGNDATTGAAILQTGGVATIVRSTVTENTGTEPLTSTAGELRLGASAAGTTGPHVCARAATSLGWNVTTDSTCVTSATDVVGVSLQLGSLANHGGPTGTHVANVSSPLVNVIPNGTPELCDASSPIDQRGSARPAGAACEVGAVEGTNGVTLTPLSLTVTSAADGVDAAPGNGVCATAGGTCTLRAAVQETNAHEGPDVVTIAPGVSPVLSLAGQGEDAAATGDLDVTDSLEIHGNGATVDAALLDRALHVLVGRLELVDLTITRGRSTTGDGCGVLVGSGMLLVDGGRFTDHSCRGGSGIAVVGGGLSVFGTTFDTSAVGSNGGAAVYVTGASEALLDGVLVRNTTGGSAVRATGTGNIRILDSVVTDNGAPGSGSAALALLRPGVVDGTLVARNQGGALLVNGAVTLSRSTVAGNATSLADGTWTGAAIEVDGGSLAIRRSTVARNETANAIRRDGGGADIQASIVEHHGRTACTTVSSAGNNVVTDATCGNGLNDQRGVDPQLGPLVPAGATEVLLPMAGSPVLDRIASGSVSCDPSTPVDQRGVGRPSGAACDVGSVEGHSASPATPRTFVVNTPSDAVDASIGDGVCATAAATCSFRAAVQEANVDLTEDTISISPGVLPTLTATAPANDLYPVDDTRGDIDLRSDVVVEGAGATLSAAGLDRFLTQHHGHLTLRDLSVTGGVQCGGGGIAVLAGRFDGQDITLWGNQSTCAGGALSTGTGVPVGLTGAVVRNNGATTSGGGLSTGGVTSIASSEIRDNVAGTSGGGLSTSGTTTITTSAIQGNTAATLGGGVSASASTTIQSSDLSDNTAGTGGGGIRSSSAAVVVRDSELSDNEGPTGGAVSGGSPVTIERSTLTGNRAVTAGSALSGAAVTTIRQSTFSNNIGPTEVANRAGNMTVTGSTLIAEGTTLFGSGSGTITVGGTILGAPVGNVCIAGIVSTGFNLADDASCGLAQATDLQTTPLEVSVLGENGGLTRTRRPLVGSPALDSIPVGTAGLCDATVPVDQRGQTRPLGVACDRGAVEGVDDHPAGPITVVVDVPFDGPDIEIGDGVCDAGGGACTLRAAIDETNANDFPDRIEIAPGVHPLLSLAGANDDLNLTGDLDVRDSVTIAGSGSGSTIDAAGLDRVLHVLAGSVEIETVVFRTTPTSGPSAAGAISTSGPTVLQDVEVGAVSVTAASLTVDGGVVGPLTSTSGSVITVAGATVESLTATGTSVVTIDDATIGPVAAGGAGSSVTVTRSTLSSLQVTSPVSATVTASTMSNGLSVSGAPSAGSTARVERSTVSGRVTLTGTASAVLTRSTVIGDSPYPVVTGTASTQVSASVLVTRSTAVAVCSGPITSGGYNLFSDVSCGAGATDRVVDADQLRPLGANGGPTATARLFSASPGVDLIPAGVVGLCDGSTAVDQRGSARPSGTGCDAGAVEGPDPSPQRHFTVTTAVDDVDSAPGDGVCAAPGGACTLRAAFSEANLWAGPDQITIAPGIDPSFAVFQAPPGTGEKLAVAGDVTLHGNGATIDAQARSAVFEVQFGTLSMHDLTLYDGHVAGGTGDLGGAGVQVGGGSLVADRVNFLGLRTVNKGGAVSMAAPAHRPRPDVLITNSTIDDALAFGLGGGIYNGSGTLVVRNTTFANSTGNFSTAVATDPGASTTLLGVTVTGQAASLIYGPFTMGGSIVQSLSALPACAGPTTGRVSLGYNVISDASCGFAAQPSDRLSTVVSLGALADNGGPTPTMLPAPGSAGINIIPLGTTNLCGGTATSDQRGVARPQGGACDAGAVEQ